MITEAPSQDWRDNWIHEKEGLWYFHTVDENEYGPYKTKELAYAALDLYCDNLE